MMVLASASLAGGTMVGMPSVNMVVMVVVDSFIVADAPGGVLPGPWKADAVE